MRVLLITPGDRARSETRPFLAAVEAEFDVERTSWCGGPWPNPDDADVVLSFVKYRHLLRSPDIDWQGFTGPRVHYDWDALQDGHWQGSPYRGTWAPTMRRHAFDVLITSGVRSATALRSAGLETAVLHKATDPAIQNEGGVRHHMFGTFGQDYPSRILMKALVRRSGLQLDAFSVDYSELGAALNRYRAVVLCSLDARVRAGRVGRRLAHWFPGLLVVPGTSPEPMQKLFEVAAAGAAPIVDWSPDLAELGFADGVNAVIYQDLDDLVARLADYRTRPDELDRIGAAAAELVASRHTWNHRAGSLRAILQARLTAAR